MGNLEVLSPASGGITTLAEYKAFYKITGTADDAGITLSLAAAEEQVLSYVQRQLLLETVRETFRLKAQRHALVLSRWPATTAGLVVEWNGEVQSLSEVELYSASGVLRRLNGRINTAFDEGEWRVTYSGGYALPPARLKQAVWRQAWTLGSTSRMVSNVRSERLEGVRQIVYDNNAAQEDVEQGLCAQSVSLLRGFLERYV